MMRCQCVSQSHVQSIVKMFPHVRMSPSVKMIPSECEDVQPMQSSIPLMSASNSSQTQVSMSRMSIFSSLQGEEVEGEEAAYTLYKEYVAL